MRIESLPSTRAALERAASVLGDRWVLLVLDALRAGPRRFGQVAEAVEGVAPNVLAERLRRLERAGLVRSEAYSTRPRRLAYALTPAGDDAARILPALTAWAVRHAGGGDLPRHDVCGTPLEVVAWCPTCRVPADDGETIHYV